MASKKQMEANRRNAKKSTGPKTEEGKAKSSLNALKHGLTSLRVWLDEEEEQDFREFRRGLLDELEPVGSLETQFVCRIAAQMWRLARVPGMEAELLCKLRYDFVDGVNTGLGDAFHKDIGTYNGSLERLARYEAILDRSLIRLLNEYRKIQADRIRREKRNAEDWSRPDFTPHDAGFRYPGAGGEPAGPPPENAEKNEAKPAGEIAEDFPQDTAIAVRPPASGQRKRRERRAGKEPNRGGNGIDDNAARGRARAQHAVPLQPPSV